MDPDRYPHQSTGTVWFDPGKGTRHFDPGYALLRCDEGILAYFAWFMERHGRPVNRSSRWGAHITFVRGEEPTRMEHWGEGEGEVVTFHYSHEIEWNNGWHAWLLVWCPRLAEIRERLGLRPEPPLFHLTLGRLLYPEER